MESGLYIDGGTFNRYFAYDFSCLFLVLPPFLSGVAWSIFSLCLLQLTQTDIVFWPPGPSHLRKGHHLLYIDIILSFVHMWEPKPIGCAFQRRRNCWISQKESILSTEWVFLASPGNNCHLVSTYIEFMSLSSCHPFNMKVKSESHLKMKYPRTESYAIG